VKLENVPFRIESELVRAWYRARRLRPSSEPFVSGDSFRALSNHVLEPGSEIDPPSVRKGDILFVQASEIERFRKLLLPGVQQTFVLITHNSDVTIDARLLPLANDPRILHWFAMNLALKHPKMTAVPIGLENRCFHWNGVIADFRKLSRQGGRKLNRILYGFTVGTNARERQPALDALAGSVLADPVSRVNSRAYRKLLVRYGFVASPPGNGVDCHRTWEALYLGVVPIVRRSMFYDHFPELPALFVDDWDEILGWNERFLETQREALAPLTGSSPYLRFDYWASLVRRVAGPA
jgi:hypothetical protein